MTDWIKVTEDTLPDDQQRCFVYCPVGISGYVMTDVYNDNDYDRWYDNYTYWMPFEFPKPPKKDSF